MYRRTENESGIYVPKAENPELANQLLLRPIGLPFSVRFGAE